jgi:spore maturation protein CgeB
VAVLDKEELVLAESGVREREYPNFEIEWITDHDFDSVLKKLTSWQIRHGGRLFYPLRHTSYMALERDFYLALYHRLKESNESNFREWARYSKFAAGPGR